MIDWQSVVLNGCWIIGLSILLAVFSYNQWAKEEQQLQLSPMLVVTLKCVAFVLIGIGLAGTSDRALESALWLFLMAIATITSLIDLRSARQAKRSADSNGT